jgi:low temperature requirement protein LtrA
MVWLLWAYTTWVTNWLDPERIQVRLLLLALMLVGIVMSAALPEAFDRGSGLAALLVGCAYAVMQIGRSLFASPAGRFTAPELPADPGLLLPERWLRPCWWPGGAG